LVLLVEVHQFLAIHLLSLVQWRKFDILGRESLISVNFYEKHQQLGKYLHIIRDSPVYPVIYDSNRTVCSWFSGVNLISLGGRAS
jgi:hypothetical protein